MNISSGKFTQRLRTWEEMRRTIWQRGKFQNDLAEDDDSSDRKFIVVVDEMQPYIFLRNGGFTGYIADIWQIICSVLNVTAEIRRYNFAVGKTLAKNGTVDIVLTPVIITTTDIDEIDFSIPIVKNWYELFMKSSDDGATSLSYLTTWSSNLWFAFLVTILVLTATLWSIINLRMRIEKKSSKRQNIPRPSDQDMLSRCDRSNKPCSARRLYCDLVAVSSVGSCFLFVWGSLTNQGYNMKLSTPSIRATILVTLFFGLLMYNAYSSVLISRLAVGRITRMFPTLDSVADARTHIVCVRKHSYAHLFFKVREDSEELQEKWKGLVNEEPCTNITNTMDIATALCSDDTVVLEAPNIIGSIIENRHHQGCTITRLYGHYARATASVLMRRNFQYRHQFNKILFNLYGSGIMDYLHRKWLYRRIPDTTAPRFSGVVNMGHILGVLLIYGVAILVAITILSVEILIEKEKEYRINKQNLKEYNHFRPFFIK